MGVRIRSTVADQYAYFRMPVSGLSSFTVRSSRNGAGSVLWTTPTVTQPDATNMPTVYALLLDEQVTLAVGNITEALFIQVDSSGQPSAYIEVELFVDDLSHVLGTAIAEGGSAPGGGPIGY
jgi:hypothetical protein